MLIAQLEIFILSAYSAQQDIFILSAYSAQQDILSSVLVHYKLWVTDNPGKYLNMTEKLLTGMEIIIATDSASSEYLYL